MRAVCVVVFLVAMFTVAHGAAVDVTEASVMPDPLPRGIPQTIWFQGFVEDSGTGEPVDATYDIVVEIFDAEVDGTSLWGPEPHSTTVIVDGWFNIELGATVDLPTFGSPPYYLELSINGEMLSPRQKLGSVPASFRSARTDDVDIDWLYSGGDIYRMSGRVGINISTPERDLDVAGTVRMDEFEMVPGALVGHVLTADASGIGTWQAPQEGEGLTLPYFGSVNSEGSAFQVDNTHTSIGSAAIMGKDVASGNYGRLGGGFTGVKGVGGTGRAGEFDGVVYVSEKLGIGIDPSEARLGVLTGSDYPAAVYAMHSSTSGATRGVLAYMDSPDGAAVYGESTADSAGVGVHGVALAPHSAGVLGESPYHAIRGVNTVTGAEGILGGGHTGIYGQAGTGGLAGQFNGKVYVTDRLGVGTMVPQNVLHLRLDNGGDSGIWIENHNTTAQSFEGIFIGDENGMNVGIAAYDDDNVSRPSALSLWNTRTGGTIQFETGGSKRMCIENDGSVGIGISTPQSRLDVDGVVRVRKNIWPATDTGASMELAYNAASHRGYVQVYDRASGGQEWGQLYLGGASVGMGTAPDYSHTLDVGGDIQCVTLYETSDGRLKTDVRELANALDSVERLRGVSFTWNEESASAGAAPGERGIGVIAQDVEEVFPELVSSPEGSHMAVDYSKLTAVLIQAVKELRAENQALSARLEAIEGDRR